MFRITREEVEYIRERFPVGCRVRLNYMNDPYRTDMVAGLLGTVRSVDDIGTVHVAWDNGSSLGVVLGEDSCSRVD